MIRVVVKGPDQVLRPALRPCQPRRPLPGPPRYGVVIPKQRVVSAVTNQTLNLVLFTDGEEQTLAEYEALSRQAGFKEVFGHRMPSPLDAVLAGK